MNDQDFADSASGPERFDPEDMSGGLMEAEHRARYWWAVQWVAGKRVLDAGCGTGYGTAMLGDGSPHALMGMDISTEALAEAREKLGDEVELVQAGVHDLPFDPESFDVVVCFEVIEHVDRQRDALAELKRVLRPGGVLLISRPEEFLSDLEARFQNVELHHAEPGSETYTIAVASDAEIANDFEVRWWHEQVDRLGRAAHQSATAATELSHEVARLSRALLESEQTSARALDLEHSLDALEAEHARATERIAYCERVIADMNDSISWKLTAPLRRIKALLKR